MPNPNMDFFVLLAKHDNGYFLRGTTKTVLQVIMETNAQGIMEVMSDECEPVSVTPTHAMIRQRQGRATRRECGWRLLGGDAIFEMALRWKVVVDRGMH